MKNDDAIDRALHMETYQMRRLEIQRLINEAAQKPATIETGGTKAVGSSAVLDSLLDRFLKRAVMSSEQIIKAQSECQYRDAYEASFRREIWLYAAEMVKQEWLSNTKLRDGAPETPPVN